MREFTFTPVDKKLEAGFVKQLWNSGLMGGYMFRDGRGDFGCTFKRGIRLRSVNLIFSQRPDDSLNIMMRIKDTENIFTLPAEDVAIYNFQVGLNGEFVGEKIKNGRVKDLKSFKKDDCFAEALKMSLRCIDLWELYTTLPEYSKQNMRARRNRFGLVVNDNLDEVSRVPLTSNVKTWLEALKSLVAEASLV